MVSINFSLPITVDGMPLKILKFRGHFGLFAAGNRVPCYNGSCFSVESSRGYFLSSYLSFLRDHRICSDIFAFLKFEKFWNFKKFRKFSF